MSDGEDKKDSGQQTEEPTAKKKEDARKEGQIATSKEFSAWAVMLAASIVIFGLGPLMLSSMRGILSHFIQSPHSIAVSSESLFDIMQRIIYYIAKILAVPAVLFIAFALLAGFIQTGVNFSTKALKPKGERLSIIKGFGRLFSAKGVIEMLKAVFKISIVVALGYWVLRPAVSGSTTLQMLHISQYFPIVYDYSLKLFIAVLSVMFVVVAMDYIYQKMTMMKQLKMSKQDIKEEAKQEEGDPHVKQKLKQIRSERGRQRMMANVPDASLVITNPTHFAIAMRYDSATMNAPLVVAKGQDHVALRIKEVAKKSAVSVIENPPLARALFDVVEIDQEIPEEFYAAIAEIIRYIMKTEKKEF